MYSSTTEMLVNLNILFLLSCYKNLYSVLRPELLNLTILLIGEQ